MAEEYHVNLTVSMIVHAANPAEALATGEDWLQAAIRSAAANGAPGSGGSISNLRVYSSNPALRQPKHQVRSLSDHNAELKAEQDAVRSTPGRDALLSRLVSVTTTDDYLTMQHEVEDWLRSHPEPYHTPLTHLRDLLGTFREAISWAESHPNGPTIWNLGALLTEIKSTAREEAEVSQAVREHPGS